MPTRLFALALAMAMTVGSPAVAFGEQDSQKVAGPDPNEKICENVTQIGSRLAKKRVCATRSEWAQRKLQDRQHTEYVQRGITTATCTAEKTAGHQIC